MLERLIDYSCHSADVEALVDGIGGGSNSSIGRRLVKRTNSSMSETSEISFDFSEGGLADDFWFNDSDYKGTGGNSSGHNSRSFHHSASSACSSCGYRYGVPDERFSLQQLARSNNSISSQRSKSCSHDDHHAGEKRNTSSTSNTLSISDESESYNDDETVDYDDDDDDDNDDDDDDDDDDEDVHDGAPAQQRLPQRLCLLRKNSNGQSKNGNSNSRSNSNSEMQLGYGGTLPAKTTVTATEELGYGDMKLDSSKAPNQVSSLEYEDASPSSTNGMPLTTNAHNKVFDPASYYATRRRNSMSTGGCRNSGISGLARVHRGGGRRASMEHTSSTTSPTTEPQQPTRSAVSFKMRRRSTSSKEETQDRGTYSITSFIKMESGVGVDDSSHSIDGSMARRGIRRSMSCDESDRHRLSRMHSNMSADSSAARRDFCANNNSTERTTGTTKNKQDTAAFLGSRIIRLDSSNPGRRGSLLKGHMKQKANVNLIKSCLLS